MLLAGVRTLSEYVLVILFWGVPFAVLAALPLIAFAKRSGGSPAKTVFSLLAGLAGAVGGYALSYRLYWQAHGQTEAIVYFLCGIVAGGLCGILAASATWRIARSVFGKLRRPRQV
jgi:hypothetical protein